MNFTLLYPLILLLLIPFIICHFFCKKRADNKFFPNLKFFKQYKIYSIETILKHSILAFMLLALSSPISFSGYDETNKDGVDIVLALDGSGSMSDEGFSEANKSLNLFQSVQISAIDFINKRVSDNLGVVLFGDFAFIASPITFEKDVVVDIINLLEISQAGSNTAIGEAIYYSIKAFDYSMAKSKVIVLLTDGKTNAGAVSVSEAVDIAKGKKIKIYTIGIGEGDYDIEMMKKISSQSGGKFFEAKSLSELKSVYDEIDNLEKSNIKSSNFKELNHLFWIPLLICYLLLFWYMILRFKRLS